MKNVKSLICLIVILVIAVVLLFFVNRSFKKSDTNTIVDPTTGETINIVVDDSNDVAAEDIPIFMVESDDVTRFTIYSILNEVYDFELDENTMKWNYVGDENVDIDESVINECIGYFTNMTTSTIITGHDKEEYGFSDNSRYIIIDAAGNETKFTFGDSNQMTGERYYVINDDFSNIYATTSGVSNLINLNLDYFKTQGNEAN